jgi:hypothetical protein
MAATRKSNSALFMTGEDLEDREDLVQGTRAVRLIDEEEEEGDAGVDYRRMFKGYPFHLYRWR